MSKNIFQSNTTKTIAGVGAGNSALLSVLMVLQQIFPQADWLSNPAILGASTWFLNVIFLPWATRMIARYRGKV